MPNDAMEARSWVRQSTYGLLSTLTAPGLWLQRITTKPPDDSQVEISIEALEGAMRLEAEKGGKPVVA